MNGSVNLCQNVCCKVLGKPIVIQYDELRISIILKCTLLCMSSPMSKC